MTYTVKNGILMTVDDAKAITAKADNVRAAAVENAEEKATKPKG